MLNGQAIAKFDPKKLDVEVASLSVLVERAGYEFAQAKHKADTLKSALKRKKSEVALFYRRNPNKTGGVKVTDKSVEDLVNVHPEVTKADTQYHDAERLRVYLWGLVKTLETKVESVRNYIKMGSNMWLADPIKGVTFDEVNRLSSQVPNIELDEYFDENPYDQEEEIYDDD